MPSLPPLSHVHGPSQSWKGGTVLAAVAVTHALVLFSVAVALYDVHALPYAFITNHHVRSTSGRSYQGLATYKWTAGDSGMGGLAITALVLSVVCGVALLVTPSTLTSRQSVALCLVYWVFGIAVSIGFMNMFFVIVATGIGSVAYIAAEWLAPEQQIEYSRV